MKINANESRPLFLLNASNIVFDILLKLMVLGDSGVGKTSFIHRFVDGKFCDKYVTTVGIDFREKTIELPEENRKISLQIWDTAGQERYRSLSTSFYRDAMGFILVFDTTNLQSFLNVSHWVVELQTHTYTNFPKVILCGNKIDLIEDRKVDTKLAKKLAKEYSMPYIETSAYSGEGLDSAIGELKNLVMSAIDGHKISKGNHKRNFSFANSVKDDEFESTLEAWQHSRQSFQCCR